MDWSEPAQAVVPSLDAAVLAVLTGVTEPLSGREVHRRSRRGSNAGVQRVLTRLVRHGLVDVTAAPPARLYQLNHEHVAADAVRSLARVRESFLARMRDELASWEVQPLAASMFGSTARGDGDLDSDVDVLLVRPDEVADNDTAWASQIDHLDRRIRRWSGNPASLMQVDRAELADMAQREAPVARSLRRDEIALTAVSVADLMLGM